MTRRPPRSTLFPTRRSSDLSAYLEAARDYLIVADSIGQVLALSDVARSLNAVALERLSAPLDTLPLLPHSGVLSLGTRSEEHTSELQSHVNLVCRLLLEKKK